MNGNIQIQLSMCECVKRGKCYEGKETEEKEKEQQFPVEFEVSEKK